MTSQNNVSVWRDCICAWYPEYETKTYFVPPVVITRIPFQDVTLAQQSVLVPQCNPAQACALPSSTQVKGQRVQDSDTREDLALQRALSYLRELGNEQNEPMFVISQLQFSGYLGEPCYKAKVKQFLRPQDLAKKLRKGSFDILVIHRHYGIITGGIKSVLSNQQQLQLSQPDVDHAVTDKVRHAVKQLNKSEVVLRKITKDLEPNITIRKLLILPYVSADILVRVVSSDEHSKQKLKGDLFTCLHAADFEQALHCCLLAENLHDQQPQKWWSTFNAVESSNTMSGELYLNLLARFCGPATTVSVYCPTSPRIEIRTEGQGVATTGERMTLLVLTREQIDLFDRAPTKVLLTGPPGVGKSVVLVLMALTWLRQGHDVHLVSVKIGSLAATHMIHHVIKMSMRDDAITPSVVGRVHLHEYDFHNKETDVDKAINTLTAIRGCHGPYVICDEFCTDSSNIIRYHRFVTELINHRPNIYLWAASPIHDQRPQKLQEERMTIPLRYPPAVLSEVQMGVSLASYIYQYTTTALATPCDGLKVIHLSHQEPEHVGRWPLECVKCGQLIAGILQRLGVGVTDSGVKGNIRTVTTTASTVESSSNTENVSRTAAASLSLQYRDVFVLTGSVDLRDDVKDEERPSVSSPANGVVRGLRDAGIPVRVIRKRHESTDVLDTAVRQSDMVTVTHYGDVSGLERKVVVWLPDRIPSADRNPSNDNWTDEEIEAYDRLLAVSRCTAQLIVVDIGCPMSEGILRVL